VTRYVPENEIERKERKTIMKQMKDQELDHRLQMDAGDAMRILLSILSFPATAKASMFTRVPSSESRAPTAAGGFPSQAH
jgi:hypothetical protein